MFKVVPGLGKVNTPRFGVKGYCRIRPEQYAVDGGNAGYAGRKFDVRPEILTRFRTRRFFLEIVPTVAVD